MARWTSDSKEIKHLVEKQHQLNQLKMAGRGFGNPLIFVFKDGAQRSGPIIRESGGNDAAQVGYPPQHYYATVTILSDTGPFDKDLLVSIS